MILALSGRRIDATQDEVISFPTKNIAAVRDKLRGLFVSLKPSLLISSGLLWRRFTGFRGSRRIGNCQELGYSICS